VGVRLFKSWTHKSDRSPGFRVAATTSRCPFGENRGFSSIACSETARSLPSGSLTTSANLVAPGTNATVPSREIATCAAGAAFGRYRLARRWEALNRSPGGWLDRRPRPAKWFLGSQADNRPRVARSHALNDSVRTAFAHHVERMVHSPSVNSTVRPSGSTSGKRWPRTPGPRGVTSSGVPPRESTTWSGAGTNSRSGCSMDARLPLSRASPRAGLPDLPRSRR
jgi:hypothetical protein